MGLLSRLMGKTQERKASDDVLLMLAMLLMVATDGSVDREELASLEAYFVTLPDFQGKNFGNILQEAAKLMRKGSRADVVAQFANLSSQGLKDKAFLLAADIALSSGDVDQNEDALLDAMQRVMSVNDATARKIIEVLSIKYAVS
ncbi:MAG: TerB family tellurite resistance protein [Myxococcota bacterium]